MQAFVARHFVIEVAFVGQVERAEQERSRRKVRLRAIPFAEVVGNFQQRQRSFVFANQQIAQVLGQSQNKNIGVKTFSDDLVEQEQHPRQVFRKQPVY